MEKLIDKAVEGVVNSIVESQEYQDCLAIRQKMSLNTDLVLKIEKIKSLQKKYLRTANQDIEKEIVDLKEELNNIPIYYEYNRKLSIVNEKINYVVDELNNFFDNLFNEGK